jgi:hypothetical protein
VLLLAAGVGCNNDQPGNAKITPFRTDWLPAIDLDLPADVTSMQFGGAVYNDNFATRGDVIVNYNGAPGRVKVEVRKFTFAQDQEEADAEFARLAVWAFAAATPKPPKEMDAAVDCSLAWQSDCVVRTYYEGQIQPSRIGMDIRVTLPPDYRQDLVIVTRDNGGADGYPDRGNVCVNGINGTLDAELESGRVFVIADSAMTPGPTCTAADIQACEDYQDPMMNPIPWDADCPCQDFGQIKVTSINSSPAQITVDIPGSTLWSSMYLDNPGADASNPCEVVVDIPGVSEDPTSTAFRKIAEINDPGDSALEGGGFNITVTSDGCGPVVYMENPDEYTGPEGEGMEEHRGDIRVCDGCVRGMTCEDLLP